MKQELIDNALRNLSISELNEMQRYVLGVYEESEDVILLSPTGSGKTLAFLLPLLSFLDPAKESVQALVLPVQRACPSDRGCVQKYADGSAGG